MSALAVANFYGYPKLFLKNVDGNSSCRRATLPIAHRVTERVSPAETVPWFVTQRLAATGDVHSPVCSLRYGDNRKVIAVYVCVVV